jgi:hypothetical protein
MRAIRNWSAVDKTSNKKNKFDYIQKIHAYLSYFSTYVTAGTEALVISGNKFLHVHVKEVCYLRAQPHSDTFHQLLIIVEAL